MNIHCIENFFTVHDFWATCARPEKTEYPWNFSLYWIYFLPFRIFEQLCACPEKQSCPGIFHCIEYTFYIQEFWATSACPEKQSCPDIFTVLNMYFYYSGVWVTCACPENRVALEFFTVLKDILLFRIFEQLAVALKTELPWNFWSPGAVHPRPPASYAYAYNNEGISVKSGINWTQILRVIYHAIWAFLIEFSRGTSSFVETR